MASRWHLEIEGPITCCGVDRELFLTQGFVILRVSHPVTAATRPTCGLRL
jgi:hypothetical protein